MRMASVFHLDGHMANSFMRKFVFNRPENFLAVLHRQLTVDDRVARQSIVSARDAPGMQVMDAFHSRHGFHRLYNVIEVNVFRRAFHQDMDRIFCYAPAADQHKDCDDDTRKRIRPAPAEEHDEKGRCYCSDRTKQIAEDVEESGTYIQIFFG